MSFTCQWSVPSSNTIILPIDLGTNLNIAISWLNNGVYEQFNGVVTTQNRPQHTYETPGNVTIAITGTIRNWSFGPSNAYSPQNLLSINNNGNLLLSPVTGYHFSNCSNLTTITGLNLFVLPSSLRYMFNGCLRFNGDVSQWDVSKVSDMSYMFNNCRLFNSPMANWNVSRVTTMSHMFNNTIFNRNINNWNVSQVSDMSFMFANSPFNNALNNWNVQKVSNMNSMFLNAVNFNSSLFSLNLKNSLTNAAHMFNGCLNFNSATVTTWDMSKVQTTSHMFKNCKIFNRSLSAWNVTSVKDMSNMFNGCLIFNQPITNWKVVNVENMSGLLAQCAEFNQFMFPIPLIFSKPWYSENKVTNVSNLFNGCLKFKKSLGNWNLNKVTDISYMFKDCQALDFERMPIFNTSLVTNMKYMFSGCKKFFGFIDQMQSDTWNCTNVQDMSYMFNGCSVLIIGPIMTNTDNVLNMSNMFSDCTDYGGETTPLMPVPPPGPPVGPFWPGTQIPINPPPVVLPKTNIASWNVSKVRNMSYMFSNCKNFNQDLSAWDTIMVTDMRQMFLNCTNFKNKSLNLIWNLYSISENLYAPSIPANFFIANKNIDFIFNPSKINTNVMPIVAGSYSANYKLVSTTTDGITYLRLYKPPPRRSIWQKIVDFFEDLWRWWQNFVVDKIKSYLLLIAGFVPGGFAWLETTFTPV